MSINLFFALFLELKRKGVVALFSTEISGSLHSICSYCSGRLKCLEVVWLSLQWGPTPAIVFQIAAGSRESHCSSIHPPSKCSNQGKGILHITCVQGRARICLTESVRMCQLCCSSTQAMKCLSQSACVLLSSSHWNCWTLLSLQR